MQLSLGARTGRHNRGKRPSGPFTPRHKQKSKHSEIIRGTRSYGSFYTSSTWGIFLKKNSTHASKKYVLVLDSFRRPIIGGVCLPGLRGVRKGSRYADGAGHDRGGGGRRRVVPRRTAGALQHLEGAGASSPPPSILKHFSVVALSAQPSQSATF